MLRKYDVLAVCDDVYNTINFVSQPPRRLFSYDEKYVQNDGSWKLVEFNVINCMFNSWCHVTVDLTVTIEVMLYQMEHLVK